MGTEFQNLNKQIMMIYNSCGSGVDQLSRFECSSNLRHKDAVCRSRLKVIAFACHLFGEPRSKIEHNTATW